MPVSPASVTTEQVFVKILTELYKALVGSVGHRPAYACIRMNYDLFNEFEVAVGLAEVLEKGDIEHEKGILAYFSDPERSSLFRHQ